MRVDRDGGFVGDVQSSVLPVMSARGELPRLDYAADPGWERPDTYAAFDRLKNEVAKPASSPIVRLSAGDIRRGLLDAASRFATMPLFIENLNGTRGMLRRHPSLKPLDQAAIDPPTVNRKLRHPRLADTSERWEGDSDGCSPWACHPGAPAETTPHERKAA